MPSDVTYEPPSNIGTLQATKTQWQDGTCPNPETPLMYLNGQGSKFSMAVLVDETKEYTVEFWFKADLANAATMIEANKDAETGVSTTFLYMMSGQELSSEVSDFIRAKDAMAIYVEDGTLKCAPFGYNQEGAEDTILTYDLGGENPLTVDAWQHITCTYIWQKFVKGQYLAVNINENGDADPAFLSATLRPKTFANSIYKQTSEILVNENLASQHRWNVILGNNGNFDKYFAGSFKDIRLWKAARSDAEIFSFRFNQVKRTPKEEL